jgi:hypothetical protein
MMAQPIDAKFVSVLGSASCFMFYSKPGGVAYVMYWVVRENTSQNHR